MSLVGVEIHSQARFLHIRDIQAHNLQEYDALILLRGFNSNGVISCVNQIYRRISIQALYLSRYTKLGPEQ
ncbi:hypothetical protein [Dyadobacter crusticola]|uniref:hypothetical protein n=1 Tax=Dyadobacter crusticola TaxID=292407 RepID=UPI0004E0CB80|nr:hypothetical protein [Dyadobacter crusticola]